MSRDPGSRTPTGLDFAREPSRDVDSVSFAAAPSKCLLLAFYPLRLCGGFSRARVNPMPCIDVAERVGFEPTVGCPTLAFQASTFVHSVISPVVCEILHDPYPRCRDSLRVRALAPLEPIPRWRGITWDCGAPPVKWLRQQDSNLRPDD